LDDGDLWQDEAARQRPAPVVSPPQRDALPSGGAGRGAPPIERGECPPLQHIDEFASWTRAAAKAASRISARSKACPFWLSGFYKNTASQRDVAGHGRQVCHSASRLISLRASDDRLQLLTLIRIEKTAIVWE